MKKKILSLLLAGTIALSLAACGGKSGTETTKESSSESAATMGESQETEAPKEAYTGEPDDIQELNLVFTDLRLLDVNDARNANEFQVLAQVQEGLFRLFTDEKGNDVISNAGCEDYEVSEDGLTYAFKIRDQKWSDGEPVTAQQYVDSIIRLLDPEKAFSYAFMAYDIVNAMEYNEGTATADQIGVSAPDDKTLVIQLNAAIPFFANKLTNVCFYPVRLDVIEAAGDSYLNDYTKHVFNGPFVISSRILENEMILEKNPNYWDAENVKLEKVTFKVVLEEATQSLLLESKELDMVEAQTDYVAKWRGMVDQGLLRNISKTKASTTYMIFNQHTGGSSGLMNNVNIRKALSLAIDRDELNELIYSGLNIPAYAIIPTHMLVGEEEFRSVAEEPLLTEAQQYLNDTEYLQSLFKKGLEEEGKNTDLSSVELTILSYNSSTQDKNLQEYFKQTYEAKLGIAVNVNIMPDPSTFVTERNENKYDMIVMGWNGDFNDPVTFMELFQTGSGYAKFMGGYSNEQFDEWLNSLSTITDQQERKEIYIKMEQNLIGENAGIAPLYYGNQQLFVQPYVKNLSTPMFGGLFEFSRAYISGK